MERERFTKLLEEATALAISFARKFVFEELPDRAIYQVLPNQSHDESSRNEDVDVYPGDSLKSFYDFHEMHASEVIQFLWRAGKVPAWINISVVAVADEGSVCELKCCGRFTDKAEHYYYESAEGAPSPFGVKSPPYPPSHDDDSPESKFSLWDPKDALRNRR